ncbi:MAG: phosphatidylserine decarboxylase [Parvicellaceae bacterium]|jgi:phosphatidylserine decarboxylase
MKIHKEGFVIILIAFLGLGALNSLFYYLLSDWMWIVYILGAASLIFFFLIVQFFRMPKRNPVIDGNKIIAPSDGKVVVIEEVVETEFFNDKRIQLSIFMSPLNVHAQWYPIPGFVKYYKYHTGKYLVAWHPKSSTENERSTIVVEKDDGKQIMFRQIAGAVARRIICYAKEGDKAEQGQNCGFIKFGSRIDVLLPLDAKILVEIDQVTVGSETVLAEF